MSWTIGIDVGGTFTDFVLTEDGVPGVRIHKSPSTPRDPSEGMLTGLTELAAAVGTDLAGLLAGTRLIVHGTTVTTNALLTGRGARTGLLTTEGFRDVLEMRRGVRSRRHLYDNRYVAPEPLVDRERRLPVRERVDAAGSVRTPLDLEQARAAVRALADQDVEAIAVCLMHAYADPAHELQLAELVRELAPDRYVSVSSEVLPQVRLYERVATTALNAYVGPVLRRYLARLVERLDAEGFGGILLVMQSNGGVALPELVAELPASTALSGPAGGPAAGRAYVREHGSEDCLIVDMGGTSYDVSMIRGGEVQVTRTGEVGGHPVALPMIDVHTIGAGGGSIGWIDDGGLLHMGPQSAGADPGPVAYGRGGTAPTCTDADVVLGYLDPAFFLGGRFPLRADLARAAIRETIADPLGLTPEEAAAAMYEVITLTMAAGTKDMALRRGADPAEFPLVAAGGAGALHVGMIAEELGVERVVIPPTSAVFCALGMTLAELRHDYVRAHRCAWEELDAPALSAVVAELLAKGAAALEREGVAPEQRRSLVAADLRYRGQHHEVSVAFDPADLDGGADGVARIAAAFHARHEELYGFNSPERPLDLISVQATVLGERAAGTLAAGEEPPPGGAVKGRRPIWLHARGGFAEVDVLDGARMRTDARYHGPCVVERETTTVLVPESFALRVDRLGSLIMQRDATEDAT